MENRSQKARANYSRICHLLVDKGGDALRNALHAVHPPSTLASVLNANRAPLQRIRYSVIKASQWDLLFPRSGAPDSNNFDVTLLTVLLRNICGLSAPATGWNVMPPVSDTSISANIVRVKMFRNELFGHFISASLGDITFETLWKEISVPLVNLGIPQNDIDELKVAPLNPEEENYIERFKEWKQQDDGFMSSNSKREMYNIGTSKDILLDDDSDSDLEVPTEMPCLKDVIDSKIYRQFKRKEIRRLDTINKLIHTERTHVRTLKVLYKVFYKPWMKSKSEYKSFGILLFPNLEELIGIHKSLVQAMMEKKNANGYVHEIGDVMLNRFDNQRGEEAKEAFAKFCQGQIHALELLKVKQKDQKKLDEFIQQCESNPLCRKLSLQGIISSSYQRLTKYPIIIEELIKATPANKPDNARLTKVLIICKEILEYVNQAVKEYEDKQRLVDFSRKIDKTPLEKSNHKGAEEFKNLDITQHKLIFDGPLTWRMNQTKHIDLHALLLEDLLVLLQKQDDKYVLKCQTETHCPVLKLSTVITRNVATDKKAFFVVGTSDIGPMIYELVAATMVERKTWLKYITEAIEFCNKKRRRRYALFGASIMKEPGDVENEEFEAKEKDDVESDKNDEKKEYGINKGNEKDAIDEKEKFSEEVPELLSKNYSALDITSRDRSVTLGDIKNEISVDSPKKNPDGSKPSLVEKNFCFSDEVTTVKHREKFMLLKAKNCNELRETKIPLKYFSKDKALRIGKGSLGTHVYVGLMEDGREVAVKKIIEETCDLLAQNELEIFRLTKDIRSPYIVNYWYFDADDFYMYLVIDLCEESLNDYVVETCSLEYLRKHGVRMIEEMLLGLQVLHDKGILHRDLKPSNILVSVDGCMQLADFGISRVLNDDETTALTEPKGTDGWIPPEVIKEMDNKGSKGRYKRKSDVHVAGMIAFFILTKGEHPFGPRLERMSNISKGKPILLDKVTALTARQFIFELISHNIDQRPSAEDALKHCFFEKQSQSIVYDS